MPYPEFGYAVIGPPGSLLVGGDEAPCLRIMNGEAGTNISRSVLWKYAGMRRFGLAVEALPMPDGSAAYSESIRPREKGRKASGQLSLF